MVKKELYKEKVGERGKEKENGVFKREGELEREWNGWIEERVSDRERENE